VPDLLACHAAALALRARRPVKIVYDRREDIVATSKRHPSRVHVRSAVARDGTFLAHDIEVLFDAGAYTTMSAVVLSRGVLHASGPYRARAVRVRGRALRTHTTPNGAFRGFGAPQTQFAIERHVDRIARAVGLDPLAIRRKNAFVVGDVTATGQELTSSVGALACLEEAAARGDFVARWQRNEAARARAGRRGPWWGVGLSLYWHGGGFTGNGEKRIQGSVEVALTAAGELEVRTAATDIGQGVLVAFAQIAASAAGGLPLELVHTTVPETPSVSAIAQYRSS
jgi:CO/xanthine dehydrogenase Mo-binding subunit